MDKKQRLELKKQSHHLKPVVLVGANGLTEAVHKEIETALVAHELMKIRASCDDQTEFKVLVNEICEVHQAEFVTAVGHTLVIFRKKDQQ